jgi:hypothetical protein
MTMRKGEFHPPNLTFTIEQIVGDVAISPGCDAALARLLLSRDEHKCEEAVPHLDQLTDPAEGGPTPGG